MTWGSVDSTKKWTAGLTWPGAISFVRKINTRSKK